MELVRETLGAVQAHSVPKYPLGKTNNNKKQTLKGSLETSTEYVFSKQPVAVLCRWPTVSQLEHSQCMDQQLMLHLPAVTGQGQVGYPEKVLLQRVVRHWHRLPRAVVTALSCHSLRSIWTALSYIRSIFLWSCVETGAGLYNPYESLPTQGVLQFCDSTIQPMPEPQNALLSVITMNAIKPPKAHWQNGRGPVHRDCIMRWQHAGLCSVGECEEEDVNHL